MGCASDARGLGVASCALEKQGERLGSVLRQSAAVDGGGHKQSIAVDSVPGRACGRAVRKLKRAPHESIYSG
jgi:hypothetical protein